MKQLTVIGHIGYDATIKEVNGSRFIEFSVAVNESYAKQDGTKVESTQWFSCTSKNLKLTEYLKKGTQVHVQGNFNVSTYQDKNRNWCSGINVHATHVQLLTAKKVEETTQDLSCHPQMVHQLTIAADELISLIKQALNHQSAKQA
jgi:single-strand DNA-binding protein